MVRVHPHPQIWPCRLVWSRTLPSQGRDPGSNPGEATKIFQIDLDNSDFFVIFVLLKFIENKNNKMGYTQGSHKVVCEFKGTHIVKEIYPHL